MLQVTRADMLRNTLVLHTAEPAPGQERIDWSNVSTAAAMEGATVLLLEAARLVSPGCAPADFGPLASRARDVEWFLGCAWCLGVQAAKLRCYRHGALLFQAALTFLHAVPHPSLAQRRRCCLSALLSVELAVNEYDQVCWRFFCLCA